MSATLYISKIEGGIPVLFSIEEDGTLHESKLKKCFSQIIALSFRDVESNTVKHVEMSDGKYFPPKGGWKDVQHFVINRSKRKADVTDLEDNMAIPSPNINRSCDQPTDLIILGLSLTTTEEDIQDEFSKIGAVEMVMIKKDMCQVSRGFGFLRFADIESQNTVLAVNPCFHKVNDEWCEVKIPFSKFNAAVDTPLQTPLGTPECKVFIKGCVSEISSNDLRQHFSRYGQVVNAYKPTNRGKPYAFLTFLDIETARKLYNTNHMINGYVVNVQPATHSSAEQSMLVEKSKAPSSILQNDRLTDEAFAEIQDVLSSQVIKERSCGTRETCFDNQLQPCAVTNMLCKKLTLTELIRILKNKEKFPELKQVNQVEGSNPPLALHQYPLTDSQSVTSHSQTQMVENPGYTMVPLSWNQSPSMVNNGPTMPQNVQGGICTMEGEQTQPLNDHFGLGNGDGFVAHYGQPSHRQPPTDFHSDHHRPGPASSLPQQGSGYYQQTNENNSSEKSSWSNPGYWTEDGLRKLNESKGQLPSALPEHEMQ